MGTKKKPETPLFQSPIVLTMKANVTFELDPNVINLIVTSAAKVMLENYRSTQAGRKEE